MPRNIREMPVRQPDTPRAPMPPATAEPRNLEMAAPRDARNPDAAPEYARAALQGEDINLHGSER